MDTLRGIMNECVSVGTVMTCFWCFFVITFSMNLFMVWCKFFWCQLYILLYFMVTVLLKYIYVVYTRSADFILLHVSMIHLKSMFISMFVNLYDEFLCYNLQ